MRHFFFSAVALTLAIPGMGLRVSGTAALSEALTSTQAPPLTMIGCVRRTKADDGTDRFVLSDAKGNFYALTGANIDSFVNKRVEVKGKVKSESPNRLHIVGGLWPTPNVAAQAGAIDAARAAIAAMPGNGPTGTAPELAAEFTVARVRAVKGGCE